MQRERKKVSSVENESSERMLERLCPRRQKANNKSLPVRTGGTKREAGSARSLYSRGAKGATELRNSMPFCGSLLRHADDDGGGPTR